MQTRDRTRAAGTEAEPGGRSRSPGAATRRYTVAQNLSGWGVKIHKVFLSDLSDAFVVRHLGGGDAPLMSPLSDPGRGEDAAY